MQGVLVNILRLQIFHQLIHQSVNQSTKSLNRNKRTLLHHRKKKTTDALPVGGLDSGKGNTIWRQIRKEHLSALTGEVEKEMPKYMQGDRDRSSLSGRQPKVSCRFNNQ